MKKGLARSKRGSSLLEVVIAMGMMVLIISGLVSAVTLSIRNSQFAKNQTLATKYGQEGLEKIRSYRDQNTWETFKGGCGSLATIIGAPPLPFTRTVFCTDTSPVDANKKIVRITVAWSDASGTHQSELTSYFSNQALWR